MSPLTTVLNGMVSGFIATIVLSILVRLLPGFKEPRPPRAERANQGRPAGITPAGALIASESPGPEGLAQQFAFKVAAGLFRRDVSAYAYALGLLTHVVYGSWWGAVFGVIQAALIKSSDSSALDTSNMWNDPSTSKGANKLFLVIPLVSAYSPYWEACVFNHPIDHRHGCPHLSGARRS